MFIFILLYVQSICLYKNINDYRKYLIILLAPDFIIASSVLIHSASDDKCSGDKTRLEILRKYH